MRDTDPLLFINMSKSVTHDSSKSVKHHPVLQLCNGRASYTPSFSSHDSERETEMQKRLKDRTQWEDLHLCSPDKSP